MVHEDCLDVCYEGYLFRLQIVATPEIEAIQMAAAVRGKTECSTECYTTECCALLCTFFVVSAVLFVVLIVLLMYDYDI